MSNTLKLPPPDGVLEFMDEDGKRTAPAWTEDSIRAVIAAAAADQVPAGHGPVAGPDEKVRVACIRLGSITLYTEAKPFVDLGVGDDGDDESYTLTFKTITRAKFDALGEFSGF